MVGEIYFLHNRWMENRGIWWEVVHTRHYLALHFGVIWTAGKGRNLKSQVKCIQVLYKH